MYVASVRLVSRRRVTFTGTLQWFIRWVCDQTGFIRTLTAVGVCGWGCTLTVLNPSEGLFYNTGTQLHCLGSGTVLCDVVFPSIFILADAQTRLNSASKILEE